jgi:hypothetical protein
VAGFQQRESVGAQQIAKLTGMPFAGAGVCGSVRL